MVVLAGCGEEEEKTRFRHGCGNSASRQTGKKSRRTRLVQNYLVRGSFQSLLEAQLDQNLPASPKVPWSQLGDERAVSSAQEPRPKSKRPGRRPGIVETKPRLKRRARTNQEHEVVPLWVLSR